MVSYDVEKSEICISSNQIADDHNGIVRPVYSSEIECFINLGFVIKSRFVA